MRKKFLAMIATAAAISMVAGCSSGPNEEATGVETIKVAIPALTDSAALYLVADQFAEKYGFKVEIEAINTGTEIVAGLATNEFDVGAAGMGGYVYNAFADGLEFDLVSYQSINAEELMWVVSSKFAPTQEAAESLGKDLSPLANEKFATVTPGGSTTFVLGRALSRGGLDISDVEVEYMGFNDMITALATGAIAGATLPEPLMAKAIADGIGFRPFPNPDTWTDWDIPSTVLAFSRNFSEKQPELAEAFLRAFWEATEYLHENGWHDEKVVALTSKYTGLEANAITSAVPSRSPKDLEIDLAVLREMQEFFRSTGSITQESLIDDEALFDMDLREKVLNG